MEIQNRKHFLLKITPLLILLLGLLAFFYFRLYEHMTLDSLKAHRAFLLSWTQKHYFVSSAIFIGIYIFMVAISAPSASLLTILGGFLFGPVFGTIYVVISASIGATIIFIVAKTAFYDFFHTKAKGFLKKMAAGFQKNAVSYLLFLRLVPLFPFWLINIVPAFFGVRIKTFFLTTLFGVLPGTMVYVLLGNGMGTILDQGKELNMGVIFKPAILIPIVGLAILALVPIVYKKFKKTTGTKHHSV